MIYKIINNNNKINKFNNNNSNNKYKQLIKKFKFNNKIHNRLKKKL